MKNNTLARYKRQLKQLISQLNKLHISGEWKSISIQKKRWLKLKFDFLLNKLKSTLLPKELSKVMAAIAAIFGFTNSNAQIFEAPIDSVFGLPTDLSLPIITSADLDNDGDLDLIITNRNYYSGSYDYTEVLYFENIGSPSDPLFGTENESLIPVPAVSAYSYVYFRNAQLADLDGDGDFDLLMSQYGYEEDGSDYEYHKWLFFENTGTISSPSFASPIENPFNLAEPGYLSIFELSDIDNDGDLDFFAQNFPYDYQNGITFQENIGNANTPNFDTPQLNPFGLTTIDEINIPRFGDIDGDGDFDLLAAGYYGDFNFFENTGTQESPIFTTGIQNTFGLVGTGSPQFPNLLDIDSDGDLDILAGVYGDDYIGHINFHKNNLITGLERIEKPDLDLFPNPTTDFINIGLKGANQFETLHVIDISGRIVLEKNINENQIQIDLRNLSKGTYTLLLRDGYHYSSQKIIKQ